MCVYPIYNIRGQFATFEVASARSRYEESVLEFTKIAGSGIEGVLGAGWRWFRHDT